MNHISLFSGIGGFDLAAERMGWKNIAHCEIDPFCQKILRFYWPDADSHTDITTTDFTKYANTIDILTGGFPCQPYSVAGKQLGKEDPRHLWPHKLRAIREIRPRWVVGENVRGLISWNGGLVFDEVQSDLEAEGYEVFPIVLPAAGVNAPHKRERIWFIAYRSDARIETMSGQTISADRSGVVTDSKNLGHECRKDCHTRNTEQLHKSEQGQHQEDGGQPCGHSLFTANSCIINERYIRRHETHIGGEASKQYEHSDNGNSRITSYADGLGQWPEGNRFGIAGQFSKNGKTANWRDFPTQSPVRSGDDGFPIPMDGITLPKWRQQSIKGYGNAVVPELPYIIFKVIDAYEMLY